jgi:hypothetical protein
VLTTTLGRRLRPALPLLVAAALLGACGSDGDETADTTTTEAEATTTVADEATTTTEASSTDGGTGEDLFGGDVCNALDPTDISAVTGEDFDAGTTGESSCTYRSTQGSAIAINVTDVSKMSVDVALEGATTACDEGTVEELTFEGAEGAFSCQVGSIASVAALGSGALVVLTGITTDPAVDTAGVIGALVQILENAIAGG